MEKGTGIEVGIVQVCPTSCKHVCCIFGQQLHFWLAYVDASILSLKEDGSLFKHCVKFSA